MAILASLRPERPNAVQCHTILLCPIAYTHLFIEVVPYETGNIYGGSCQLDTRPVQIGRRGGGERHNTSDHNAGREKEQTAAGEIKGQFTRPNHRPVEK